jgi:hypothetical protein
VGLLSTYLLLLFPDGRLPSRRWRSPSLALRCGHSLARGRQRPRPRAVGQPEGVRNPFGIEGAPGWSMRR